MGSNYDQFSKNMGYVEIMRKRLLIILGPTATGKTDLALQLAKKLNGELVSCDSRQVYKGLDIGTGKLPSIDVSYQSSAIRPKRRKGFWEIDGIKIWMYDVVDFREQYNVADYVKDANKVINNISNRKKLPILVGGTGLYLKALLEGLPNLAIPPDKNLRKKLEKLSKKKLQEKLQKIAPDRWENLNESDRENPRRLIRAIEIVIKIKTTKTKNKVDKNLTIVNFLSNNILKIGLTAPRQILYRRIDERVVDRINQGMIEEVKKLHKSGLTFERMRQLGLEYRVLVGYLEGEIISKEDLVKILQSKIHGFARRQMTWFKKDLPAGPLRREASRQDKNIYWFDISKKYYYHNVEKAVAKWYY